MFREVWDADVSSIYREILGMLLVLYLLMKLKLITTCRMGGAEVWEAQERGSVCWACKAIRLVDTTLILLFATASLSKIL